MSKKNLLKSCTYQTSEWTEASCSRLKQLNQIFVDFFKLL